MIILLRHTAARLWLLLLWGIPAWLWLLPRGLVWFPELPAGLAMIEFLGAGGIIQGLVLDLTGRRRISGLIREGELWEQAGIRSRAEERYLKAVRVFDSFLISPWAGRGVSRELTRVMAGFYLTGPVRYAGFRQAAARYLLYRPEDETLALLWLDQTRFSGRDARPDSLARSVLTALAEAHHDHPKIASRLVIPFLDQERADFPARRLYRSVLRQLEAAPDKMTDFPSALKEKMAAILGSRGGLGDADLQARPAGGEQTGVTLGDQVFSPDISGAGYTPPKTAGVSRSREGIRTVCRAVGGAGALIRPLVQRLISGGSSLFKVIPLKGRTMGQYTKVALVSVLAVWLGFFLWSSLAYMLKSTSMEPVMHPVAGAASGPFTIQVAAYLKPAHADRYLQELKGKGLGSAYIKKTMGGGKTWYLVRISHFKTKLKAAEYGRKLKSQGKIEEFFVSNT